MLKRRRFRWLLICFLPFPAENDRALDSIVFAWQLEPDLHRREDVGVSSARHGEGSTPAIWDEERASGRHLPTVSAYVPALVPLPVVKVLEVVHGQGDIPASRSIRSGHRRARSRLSRSLGWNELEGDGPGWETAAKAEWDDNGGSDDGSSDSSDSSEAASITSPHRQPSDHCSGLRLGRWRLVGG